MPYDCPAAGKENVLYVCFGYKVPLKSKLVDYIRFRDGQPAIFFVEFTSRVEDIEEKVLPEEFEVDGKEDSRFKNGVLPSNYSLFWPSNDV